MLREAVVGRDKKGDELIPRNGFEILGHMIALALQENSKAISHGEPGMKLCSRFEINDPTYLPHSTFFISHFQLYRIDVAVRAVSSILACR